MTQKRDAAAKTAAYCQMWPQAAADEMLKMVRECKLSDAALVRLSGTAQNNAIKGGFAAELLHKETFNLDAILNDKTVRAFTDKCDGTPLTANHQAHDIVMTDTGQQVGSAQLKYFRSPKDTADAFRDIRDGAAHYKDVDAMVGPSDQLAGIKGAARRTELGAADKRPVVADAARDVQAKATDRLSHDGVESTPLSKADAVALGKGDKTSVSKHEEIQNTFKRSSTLKHSMKAAGSAALITTVIAGTLNTIRCLDDVQNGKLETREAIAQVLKETGIAAADSALKAGVATAAVSQAVDAMPALFSGSILQTSLASGTVAGAAICAVDVAECLVLVAMGRMTTAEMQTRTGKNILQTTAGVVGASIGAAIGAPAGPIGIFIGSFIGGMITSVAATVAIENGIERPWQMLLADTASLVDTQTVMVRSVEYLAIAQESFGHFAIGLQASEKAFMARMIAIRENSADLRNRIENL